MFKHLYPLALILLLVHGLTYSQEPKKKDISIRYVEKGEKKNEGRFEVVGLPAEALKILENEEIRKTVLNVFVDSEIRLLGTSGISEGVLWFQPRFPLAFDVKHCVKFESGRHFKDPVQLQLEYTLKRPATPPTHVVQVYPTSEMVPENLLKFYLEFSGPMKRGEVYKHVKILDAKGKPVVLPFLELDEELWDVTGTRLTLFIDPGRIKRGLKPREEDGPVLEAGERYTLEISTNWKDGNDQPLSKKFQKSFKVGEPINEIIDVSAWVLVVPKEAKGSLEVKFPRPLDRALLERTLTITDAKGNKIKGKGVILENEKGWRFTPDTMWEKGTYTLQVHPDLEDLAGNRPDRIFDRDLERAEPTSPPILNRSFEVHYVVR
jgi:hypothetical protein